MKRRFFLKLSTAGAAGVLWGCQDEATMHLSHGPVPASPDRTDGAQHDGATTRRGVHVSEVAYTVFDPEGYSYEIEPRSGRVIERGVFGLAMRQFGSLGTGPKQLNGPTALAFGPDDLLYVVDSGNHRVQVFERDGSYAGQIGSADTLSYPQALFIDAEGLLFVADTLNHRVQVFDPAGELVASFGELGTELGQLNGPVGIAQDRAGFVHVLEVGNRRVQVFTKQGKRVGSYGDREQLGLVRALALASDGTSFVADVANAVVHVISPDGRAQQAFAPRFEDGSPAAPVALALAPNGDLYVTGVMAFS